VTVGGTMLSSVRAVRFPVHSGNGDLTVFEGVGACIPFPIRRFFTIAGVAPGTTRGNHAHRFCTQVLACLSGSLRVELNDGRATSSVTLAANGFGLLIPPRIWNRIRFKDSSTVLAVICDQSYSEDDYLRDWDEFVRLNGDAFDRPATR